VHVSHETGGDELVALPRQNVRLGDLKDALAPIPDDRLIAGIAFQGDFALIYIVVPGSGT
jgi:hypothetical protein